MFKCPHDCLHNSLKTYIAPQSVFNRFAGVVVPLLWEFESSEKFICVDVNSVGPWESLTVEKPATCKI